MNENLYRLWYVLIYARKGAMSTQVCWHMIPRRFGIAVNQRAGCTTGTPASVATKMIFAMPSFWSASPNAAMSKERHGDLAVHPPGDLEVVALHVAGDVVDAHRLSVGVGGVSPPCEVAASQHQAAGRRDRARMRRGVDAATDRSLAFPTSDSAWLPADLQGFGSPAWTAWPASLLPQTGHAARRSAAK